MQELVIIFVIALIVFGPRKLPQLGKSLGRSIAEFKRASAELRHTLEDEIRIEETRKEILEPIESIKKDAEAAVTDMVRSAESEDDDSPRAHSAEEPKQNPARDKEPLAKKRPDGEPVATTASDLKPASAATTSIGPTGSEEA
jgi:TatA/E family protein of Tat protein translocase